MSASRERSERERHGTGSDPQRRPVRETERREGTGSPWPDEPVLHDA